MDANKLAKAIYEQVEAGTLPRILQTVDPQGNWFRAEVIQEANAILRGSAARQAGVS